MSYSISPWRVTIGCDHPGCRASVEGDVYESASDLRDALNRLGERPGRGGSWLCAHVALRPGGHARRLDLCPQHAAARAAAFARVKDEREAARQERREEQQADRAARRLERTLRARRGSDPFGAEHTAGPP